MLKRTIASFGLLLAHCASVNAQFAATLDGLQENPDVITTGTGTGSATYNSGTDMLAVSLSFSDLMGTTTDSHIHCCTTPDLSTGVAVGFTPHGFPLGVTAGVFNANIDLSNPANYTGGFLAANGGTATGARNALLAGMRTGMAYFNIHTQFRGSGEIRGNITPEPSSLLLVLCGLAAVAFSRRVR